MRASPARRLRLERLENRLAPATFTVLNNNDAGPDSLWQAILDANLTAVADTINFDAALTNQTITLSSSELAITKPVTITGLGSVKLTIDANNASRIFNIDDGTTAKIAISISGLKLTHGASNSSGGGILNKEALTIANCLLDQNSASGSYGGGISNSGAVTVTNSTLSSNFASNLGGGIYNSGTLAR